MAKKTRLATPRESSEVAPKLRGLTFVFVGTFSDSDREKIARHVREEGGRIVEDVLADVDYLVTGWKGAAAINTARRTAERLNKAQGVAIRIIDEQGFNELFKPTRDEALALLAGGEEGRERWGRLMEHWRWTSPLDLRGVDFRRADLRGIEFGDVTIDGNDFSGADLSGTRFERAANCTFDGATMRNATVSRCRPCTFRDVNLREVTR